MAAAMAAAAVREALAELKARAARAAIVTAAAAVAKPLSNTPCPDFPGPAPGVGTPASMKMLDQVDPGAGVPPSVRVRHQLEIWRRKRASE